MSQVVNRNQIIKKYIYIYIYDLIFFWETYTWYEIFFYEKNIWYDFFFFFEKLYDMKVDLKESNPEFSYLNMQLSWLVFAVTI